MNCGMISGSEACFHICTKPNPSTRKLVSESCRSLLFKNPLVKPSISIKTPYGSTYYRTRRTTRAAIDNLSETSSEATEGTEKSFYELLGISESGTLSEIKKAYKQLALRYHPDVSPPNRAEEYTRRFIRVQEAYQTLSNPKTRALYDTDLAKGFHLAFTRRGFYDQVSFSFSLCLAFCVIFGIKIIKMLVITY
ncbi:hypothetical protein CsSME_00015904 [Camellia sinensis var. sinensis]